MRSLTRYAPFLGACALGCGDDAKKTASGLEVPLSVCASGLSATVDNPYLPLTPGMVHVLEGLEGGTSPTTIRMEVLAETAEVGGVTARIVQSAEVVDGVVGAPQWEYYAQAPDGTVCIVGEDEDADDTPEWQAGEGGWQAGVYLPGHPAVGMTYDMKHGPDGIERGEITHVGVRAETPAGVFDDTLTVLEDGPSLKKYARGIGMIFDDGIELISY